MVGNSIARADALAVAEQVGVAAGQIATQLDQLHALMHGHDGKRPLAILTSDLARQVSALAGAVERLLVAV